MLCRHASLADSLVSAWVITSVAGMNPRYVLKRELLVDPCLDIVGNRLPNHFLDRGMQTRNGGKTVLHAPVDRCLGKMPADVAHHRQVMNDIAERRSFHEQEAHRQIK